MYNQQGQRRNRGFEIDEEIIHAVEHAQLASQYMCRSSKKTEYHKSTRAECNGARATCTHVCKMCHRRFKSSVNLTLHVYWHTINDHNRDDDPDDPVDNSENEDEESASQYRFVASPGWVANFQQKV